METTSRWPRCRSRSPRARTTVTPYRSPTSAVAGAASAKLHRRIDRRTYRHRRSHRRDGPPAGCRPTSWRRRPVRAHVRADGQVVSGTTPAGFAWRPRHRRDLPRCTCSGSSSRTRLHRRRQRIIAKLVRRVEPGLNPDVEVPTMLPTTGPSTRVPAVATTLDYERDDSETTTVLLAHELIHNEGGSVDVDLRRAGPDTRRARASRPPHDDAPGRTTRRDVARSRTARPTHRRAARHARRRTIGRAGDGRAGRTSASLLHSGSC